MAFFRKVMRIDSTVFHIIFFYNSTRLAFRLRSFINIRELSGQLKILVP